MIITYIQILPSTPTITYTYKYYLICLQLITSRYYWYSNNAISDIMTLMDRILIDNPES